MTPTIKRLLLDRPGFYPYRLANNAAWYDIQDVSSMRNAAGTVPVSGDAIKLVGDKSGNSDVNVLALNGVAGNYASAPDSVAVSILSDIELVAHVAPESWAPAAINVIVNKYAGAGQRSYRFYINTTGKLHFDVSADGTAVGGTDSSAATGFNAYSTNWIKITWRASDGRTQFFTAADQSSEPTSWTQLGTDMTAAVASIFDSTSALEIGVSNGVFPFAGRIYQVILRNGIAGTIAFDANFATFSKLAASGTESSSNAATVTINTTGATGARICGARDAYQGVQANQPILTISPTGNYLTFDGSNDYMKAAAFALAQPVSVYFAGSQVTWTFGKGIFDGNTNASMLLQQYTNSSANITQYAGAYGGTNTGFGTGATKVITAVFNAAASALRVNRGTAATGNCGASNGNGFLIGCDAGVGAAFANITVSGVLVRSAADPLTLQDRIIMWFGRYLRIPV